MSEKPDALRLVDELEDASIASSAFKHTIAAELRRLHALVAACEPYLKEDETPAQRIERERGDTDAICRLYAKERKKNEELLEALKDAVNAIEHWGTYSSDYFQKKWDLQSDINAARAAITRAEGKI